MATDPKESHASCSLMGALPFRRHCISLGNVRDRRRRWRPGAAAQTHWPKQTQAFWINIHALIGIFPIFAARRAGLAIVSAIPLPRCRRMSVHSLAAFQARCTWRFTG